jgi:hypothetical protein
MNLGSFKTFFAPLPSSFSRLKATLPFLFRVFENAVQLLIRIDSYVAIVTAFM